MLHDAKEGVWSCKAHDYSIVDSAWYIVLLHSAVLAEILLNEGIEDIIYEDCAIRYDVAMSPSHFLPLVTLVAHEMSNSVALEDNLAITAEELSDDAAESSLLGFHVYTHNQSADIGTSLQQLTAAVQIGIDRFKQSDQASSSVMPYGFLNWTQLDSEETAA